MLTVKIKSACRVNSAILSFYMCVFRLGVSQQADMKHSVTVSIVIRIVSSMTCLLILAFLLSQKQGLRLSCVVLRVYGPQVFVAS